MPLTREQAVARIELIIEELTLIMDQLKAPPAAAKIADPLRCPVHNVPWTKTTYGLAHKLNDGSGKWCHKEKGK